VGPPVNPIAGFQAGWGPQVGPAAHDSLVERKWSWLILGGMKRHTPWIQFVAVVLVIVGLVTLAAPAPAHAMDPQLMLALASAAGAIALIVGYLIVANGRERQRAASLEGIYTCGDREASGPMGCGGPGSSDSAPVAVATAAASESPMATEGGNAPRPPALATLESCPSGQVSGLMGCGGPMGLEPVFSSATSAPAALPSAVQGQ